MPRNAALSERYAWHLEHQERCGCRPMPPGLARGAGPAPAKRALPLRDLLLGGDRRSLRGSRVALAQLLAKPRRIPEVAALVGDEDRLVSLRATDLLEKVAHLHADWVNPHRALFIGALADSAVWEVRLQVVRALPLLTWTPSERRRVLEILMRDLRHPRTFVRAWSLDGLATLAQRETSLWPLVERHLREFERSESRALRARARHIRKRLPRDRTTLVKPGPA